MSSDLITLISNELSPKASISNSQDDIKQRLKGTEGLEYYDDKIRTLVAIVIVGNSDDIQQLLALANCHANDPILRFSIYPISTGNNWGYGTSQPTDTADNIILLDLSQLNDIVDFDRELGLITVEPGVTQQQLSDYLVKNNYDYMVPVTGAGPNCSILANALERGYGITPYTEHFSATTAIQGYWADGSSYQSAISHLDKSSQQFVDKTFKWGLGPYLDGLFTQSSYGIVTQMTIRLAKRKAAFTSFFVQIDRDELLEQVVPLIRKVLQNYEGIVGSINLMDKRRILSMFAENPKGYDTHTNMTASDVTNLAKKLQTPSWTVVGTIYGSKAVVKAVKSEIQRIFKTIPSKQIYSNSVLISFANRIFSLIPKFIFRLIPLFNTINEQLTSFNLGEEIMLGKPNKVALKLAYWRNPNIKDVNPNDMHPSDDNCGLLWYAPLVTMKPNVMREYVDFIREICPKHNIEPFITFTNLRHDCIDSTIPIVFDLSNPQAVNDAHNCLKELVERGLEKGFVPYRLNIDQQQWLLNKDDNFWKTANKLKETLDPNGILSPKRYNPSSY